MENKKDKEYVEATALMLQAAKDIYASGKEEFDVMDLYQTFENLCGVSEKRFPYAHTKLKYIVQTLIGQNKLIVKKWEADGQIVAMTVSVDEPKQALGHDENNLTVVIRKVVPNFSHMFLEVELLGKERKLIRATADTPSCLNAFVAGMTHKPGVWVHGTMFTEIDSLKGMKYVTYLVDVNAQANLTIDYAGDYIRTEIMSEDDLKQALKVLSLKYS